MATTTDNGWNEPEPAPRTACKHGLGECERCGTSQARDALHTTSGGRGVVGKLRTGKP